MGLSIHDQLLECMMIMDLCSVMITHNQGEEVDHERCYLSFVEIWKCEHISTVFSVFSIREFSDPVHLVLLAVNLLAQSKRR